MITKTGHLMVKQAELRKIAIDPVTTGALMGAAHVGQNIGLRWALNNLEKSRLLNVIIRAIGKPGQGMSTIPGNIAYGATTGVLPEIGMLEEKLSKNVGKKLEKALQLQGLNINKLPRRHATALSLAAQGRFKDAYRVANTPYSREALDSVMSQFYPNIDAVSGNFPMLRKSIRGQSVRLGNTGAEIGIDQKKFEEVLDSLGEQYRNHPLTGQIAEAFKGGKAKKITEMLKGDDNAIKRFARNGTNLATRAALFPTEAGMAILNEGKRFADWEALQKTVPTKMIQDFASEKLVTNPIRKGFERGLSGEKMVQFKGFRDASADIARVKQFGGQKEAQKRRWEYTKDGLDAFGLNAFTNMGKHMANNFGLALNRFGIKSMEDIDKLRASAERTREAWKAMTAPDYRFRNAKLVRAPRPQALPTPEQSKTVINLPKSSLVRENPKLNYRDIANGASLISFTA